MMIQLRAPSFGQDDLLRQPMQVPNIARPVRAEEVDEIDELERSVVIDVVTIPSEVHPLCSNQWQPQSADCNKYITVAWRHWRTILFASQESRTGDGQ